MNLSRSSFLFSFKGFFLVLIINFGRKVFSSCKYISYFDHEVVPRLVRAYILVQASIHCDQHLSAKLVNWHSVCNILVRFPKLLSLLLSVSIL